MGLYFLLKGRCKLNFEVTKVRADQALKAKGGRLNSPDYDNEDGRYEDGVYHGDGGEEDLEVELEDGVHTDERGASPAMRDRHAEGLRDIIAINKQLDVAFNEETDKFLPKITVKETKESSKNLKTTDENEMKLQLDKGFNLTEVPLVTSKTIVTKEEIDRMGLNTNNDHFEICYLSTEMF